MVVFYVGYGLSTLIQGRLSAPLSQRIIKRMRSDLFGKIIRLPVSFIDSHSHGDLMSRMTNDAENVSNVISQSLSSLFSGLLMLAATYEAEGRVSDAEAIYVELYTHVVPTASEPYTNEIRILLASDRLAEAAELMQTAYQATGQTTYRTQRNELLPKAPETNVYAGLYEEKKNVTLTSSEEYEIYYTFNADAELPEEGKLYTEPIFLDEGIWSMRAVAVNGQLVSDELSAVYRIIMPSPQTPRASLAPNTYKQRQRVRLWPGLDNVAALPCMTTASVT